MPYRVETEYCGKWWHFWWAGPLLYVHLVDIPDLSPSYCEVAQPSNLLGLRKHSIPIACTPLVYRVSEDKWVVAGTRVHHYYRRADSLAEALEEAAQGWPHWCRWAPHGPLPPAVLDVELLEEALLKMPVLKPAPEELAVDFVLWSYYDLADFLRSEYVHLVRSPRAEARWKEICEHEDPRACYPGALGEILEQYKEQGKTPAVASALFGLRYAKPWGFAESSIYIQNRRVRVYYVLGHVLRGVVQRNRLVEQADVEIPILPVDESFDPQGPIMRRARKRRPEPHPVIEPIDSFPTSGDGEETGGPFAAFDFIE